MKEISVLKVKDIVKDMFIECNWNISKDIYYRIKDSTNLETQELPKEILGKLVENMDLAIEMKRPVCQDTGMAIIYVNIGQEVKLVDGFIGDAINEGVRNAYELGYLRKSVVGDPLIRKNTNDNTPAIIKYNMVKGDKLEIEIMAKGFGSENMSKTAMLKPADGIDGVKEFVIDTVKKAGGNPCPPIIVGVGIGGTFDECAYISKRALLRSLDKSNPDEFYKKLEDELLESINNSDIGPQGLGGVTTALKVQIETLPTHIAGLPVAVNISCHASRHMKKEVI